MPKGKRRSNEELADVAKKYDNLSEFKEKDNATYQLIGRRGLLKELCKHMKRKVRQDLTEDELAEIVTQYDSLSELQKKDHTAYSIICRRGLLDKLCGNLKRKTSKYRTNEDLSKIASNYGILKEFREEEPAAYHAIQERGLLKELCGHMEREASPPLSDDDLAEIASNYTVLKDFRSNENSVYTIIRKRGLFNKLCGQMKRGYRDLTDGLLADIASGYSTREEFCEKDSSAYSTACRRRIIDKICAHMDRQVMPVGYWTKERCQQKAKDYNTKEDFRQGCPSAHGAAQKNGWLDDICSHMVPRGNWFKRKIYVFTFSDGYAYVGLAQDPADRYRAHVSGRDKKSPVLPHIKETDATYEFKLLTDWLDKDVAAREEEKYRKEYAAEGWKMLNKIRGGGLGGTTKVYTHERILREVGKYEYVDDLRDGSPLFYKYILRHHLWEEYCGKMKFKRAPNCYWTIERAISVVPECKFRSELRKKYYQAYKVLSKHGLLDKYYPEKKAHPKREKIWTIEKSLTIVNQCTSRFDLSRKFPGAYVTLRNAGLLEKYFPTKWVKPFTEEEKAEIIAACKTRSELHHKHKSIYDYLRRAGLLDKYFPLDRKELTEEERMEILKSCTSRSELREKA